MTCHANNDEATSTNVAENIVDDFNDLMNSVSDTPTDAMLTILNQLKSDGIYKNGLTQAARDITTAEMTHHYVEQVTDTYQKRADSLRASGFTERANNIQRSVDYFRNNSNELRTQALAPAKWTKQAANFAKSAGRIFGWTGIALDFTQTLSNLAAGNYLEAAKTGAAF